MSTISARIERMPFSSFHRRLLLMASRLHLRRHGRRRARVPAAVLRTQWSLSSVQTGVLGSGTFIGYFLGGCSRNSRHLIGRRRVMMLALVIYCVASLASATAHDWPFFLATRIVAGLVRRGERDRCAVLVGVRRAAVSRCIHGSLAGFFSFGSSRLRCSVISYPACTECVACGHVITALPIVMLLWWRRALPESPRWLVARGRHAEAEAIVAKAEPS